MGRQRPAPWSRTNCLAACGTGAEPRAPQMFLFRPQNAQTHKGKGNAPINSHLGYLPTKTVRKWGGGGALAC